MPWNPDHKRKSRQRILLSAGKLFTRDGYDNVSIQDVMTESGLTRGAFYSHFSSKTELYAEAIVASARNSSDKILSYCEKPAVLDDLIKGYLSSEHRSGEQVHCPLAFLITDIAQRDDQIRDTYTRVFRGFVNNIYKHQDYADIKTQEQAMQTAVLMIGGMAIARAINDDELAESLLDVCRSSALMETPTLIEK